MPPGYITVGGERREIIDPSIAVSGERKAVIEGYITVSGERKQWFQRGTPFIFNQSTLYQVDVGSGTPVYTALTGTLLAGNSAFFSQAGFKHGDNAYLIGSRVTPNVRSRLWRVVITGSNVALTELSPSLLDDGNFYRAGFEDNGTPYVVSEDSPIEIHRVSITGDDWSLTALAGSGDVSPATSPGCAFTIQGRHFVCFDDNSDDSALSFQEIVINGNAFTRTNRGSYTPADRTGTGARRYEAAFEIGNVAYVAESGAAEKLHQITLSGDVLSGSELTGDIPIEATGSFVL